MNKIIKLSVRNLNDEEITATRLEDRDFPQVALTLNNENGDLIDVFYLYPLRGYFFQIGGLNANGSMAQGPHFLGGAAEYIKRLKQIGMGDYEIRSIFNSEAAACVLKFIRMVNTGSTDSISFIIDEPIGVISGVLSNANKVNVWSDFISYTVEFFSDKEVSI